jgi:hypothetical protein
MEGLIVDFHDGGKVIFDGGSDVHIHYVSLGWRRHGKS